MMSFVNNINTFHRQHIDSLILMTHILTAHSHWPTSSVSVDVMAIYKSDYFHFFYYLFDRVHYTPVRVPSKFPSAVHSTQFLLVQWLLVTLHVLHLCVIVTVTSNWSGSTWRLLQCRDMLEVTWKDISLHLYMEKINWGKRRVEVKQTDSDMQWICCPLFQVVSLSSPTVIPVCCCFVFMFGCTM